MNLARRFCVFFRRSKLDREMDDELRFHIEEQTHANLAAGMSPEEAALAARKQFGWRDRIREEARDARGWMWLEDFWRDSHHALRSLRRVPGFTTVAVLTLGLGIGAATTVFSWTERVLLNPLPGVVEVGRIAAVSTLTPSREPIDSSVLDFHDFQARTKMFSRLLAYKHRLLRLGEGTETEAIYAQLVSADFFSTLGVSPARGRFFAATDRADEAACAPVAVISDALWRRRFQADASVLGRPIKLNQQEFTVIGIAPPGFLGALNGLAYDVWAPVTLDPQLTGSSPSWLGNRKSRAVHVLGRLAPGATIESAKAELVGIAAQLSAAFPDSNRGVSVDVLPLARSTEGVQSALGRPLLLLMAVSALVLLIVGANLSNLLLVRASTRQREMTIRQALGAGWLRLVRQSLTESLLLSTAGGLLGLALTFWMSDLLRFFIPQGTLPISLAAEMSPRVLLVAISLTAVTAFLAGIVPSLWAARSNLAGALRVNGRPAGLSPRAEKFRSVLVVAQVAVAVVTLACGALAAKSFQEARRANPGFDPRGVLLGGLKLDGGEFAREQRSAFFDALQERLAAIPGVEAAALACDVPLGLSRGSWDEVSVPGYAAEPNENMRLYRNYVSPGYFALMRIPLLEGREFTPADRRGAPFVAVVNETFARRYFGTPNAVGRTFSTWGGSRQITIVGVAKDSKIYRLDEPATPYFYAPLQQFFGADTSIALQLRTSGDPLALLPAVRAEVRALDPDRPIVEALTLDDYVSASRYGQKTAASLLGVLSVVALSLTTLGIYGVLAFAVAQRTPEFGVRLALGAHPRDIVGLVLRRGFVLVGLGLALGLIGAAIVSAAIGGFFYGVSPNDPLALIVVICLIVIFSALACWLPARRATKVDPMIALRAE